MAKWRVKRGDKTAGEVPSSKIRQLAAAGKLKKTDLLCKEGTDKWVVAGNVKGLWQANSPSPTEAVSTKDQNEAQTAPPSSPASAGIAAQTGPVDAQASEVPTQTLPQPQATEASPQQEARDRLPQQQATETPTQQEAIAATSQQQVAETIAEPETTEPSPEPEIQEPLPQKEVAEAPSQLAPPEPLPEQEEVVEEPLAQQEAFSSEHEAVEEYADSDIQAHAEPDEEYLEEPYDDEEYLEEPYDDEAKAPRRKWFVPLVTGLLGCFLIMGLMARFMSGDKQEGTQPNLVAMREQQSASGQQQRSRSNSRLQLTQEYFQPNIERNVQYTSKRFEKNTTVALHSKTMVEKWNSDAALYFHEKDFRNYGQTVPYRVSNGYVQLKAGENWFRFLKLDAKVGDKWTPGDGEDGTVDWTGKGEIELFNFKTVDSVPVAIVEFTAKPELSVPSYLVPAAFDFGLFVTDGSGPIEGMLRFELGQGLGMLRVDAIVPKGKRHKNGGGRDSSDWIFATRSRNISDQNDSAATDEL